MWIEFLNKEEKNHSKQEYYLAQIAAEVRRGNAKNPRRVRVEDFLLEFKEQIVNQEKEVDVETLVESHKRFWLTSLGLKSDGSS